MKNSSNMAQRKRRKEGAVVVRNGHGQPQQQREQARHRVALVSDFFYPRLGGVENHILSLAQELLKLGHKVIVVTHAYKGKKGVHLLENDLKVYYCPIVPMTDEDCLPTFTATFPLLRWIFIREQIEIVHAHQATSTLANESVVYAGMLGLASVYTDHSLFSLHDAAGVILNRVLTTTLSTVDAAIGVSQACRDNLILRTRLDTNRVFVVPNAVDAAKFQPLSSQEKQQQRQQLASNDRIVVVVISRLAYRKGVDLLVGIIPIICKANDKVDFVVAGDGPKRLALQEMVEAERLQERVTFLGAVQHASVRDVLVRGHIFLNCSLTESFCIAILEASCAGLAVVTTNVGGIPEVLDEGVVLADPNVPDMAQALQKAITEQQQQIAESAVVDPWPRHQRLGQRYAWSTVAQQTLKVYQFAKEQPRKTFLQRLECYRNVGGGGITGLVVAWLAITVQLFAHLVQWLQPHDRIDILAPTDDES